ncbi:MAG: SDR family NAD(P)-dependent oxidoreductase [Thermodesulfobacteriota bacterium]|jgi:NAD(P)-dependent dehydrogenase (short-subunit alcohol dehydrogenase family)
MAHPVQTLRNQVILVTGATDGLGKRVARDLAAQGATVLLHGRSREKGEATLQEIREATGNHKLIYYNADFSSLDAVRQLSKDIQTDQERLDVLINNAGTGAGLRQALREKSTDGYELRFAVNYLAPFLLTHRLLPLLRRSAPARIVNVASAGQRPIDFDNVMLEDGYDGLRAYRQSKLALVMFTFDLAEDLRKSGITVNSLHPATLMSTRMVLETDYFAGPMSTVEEGAHAVEYLATSPDLGGVTGEYFDGKQRARANAQAYDKEARRRLRILSEQLTKLKEFDD